MINGELIYDLAHSCSWIYWVYPYGRSFGGLQRYTDYMGIKPDPLQHYFNWEGE